ncbi:AAA family ATPase [Methylophaga sp.]|uniref:McrB family protein n=1 Tax=Methylophaga sp. TaxID=2024840 RepID=UPI003A941C80
MSEQEKGFSLAELSEHSDTLLIQLLKQSWDYDLDQPFVVIGQLKAIPRADNSTFYILENLKSVNDGRSMFYPIDNQDIRHTVFIGVLRAPKLGKQPSDGMWVKAKVVLSPEKERTRHNNPFALKTVDDGLQPLEALPEEVARPEFVIDGQPYIEKWVIDFYREKNQEHIQKEADELRTKLQEERSSQENQVAALREEAGSLSEQVANQTETLENTTEKLRVVREQHTEAEAAFQHQKIEMERQLSKLNQFIEQKAQMLVDLDLISQADADALLGSPVAESRPRGHNFLEVFGGDLKKAISYIQAYLMNRHIVYRRKVLEDFFALITMHDLIVLAGDSGSGKTNLVKSFAEAVGGKAVIVPVKPNWTSAEDLLGYYNPLERKYLTTPFLDAIFEAARNPDTPYFICLDEMNLARVEYYFADFLSLLEERAQQPEIPLYSASEAEHLISEARNFLSLIEGAKEKLDKPDLVTFLDLLRDEELNTKLQELCGFGEGESLLKYHAQLRKLMGSYLNSPSSLKLPANVRIIGTINVDETTHYLSPKILDRVHIMRFTSPLLADWTEADAELELFELDMEQPINFDIESLGKRANYPEFERNDPLVETLIHMAREYLEPLGVEFGLRTVRQALLYSQAIERFQADDDLILNNIVLHKILPKLMFDGEKAVDGRIARKDVLIALRDFMQDKLSALDTKGTGSCIDEMDRVIANAKANDWVVNYWSR